MRLDTEFSKVAKKYPDHLAIKHAEAEFTSSEIERFSQSGPIDIPEVSASFYINSLAAMRMGKIAGAPDNDVPYNDGAWLAYTSGSTGSPKAVVHGHSRMVKLAFADIDYYRLTSKDRIGMVRKNAVPAYRLGFAALLSGTPLIIRPPDVDLGEWMDSERITVIDLTATGFRHLMLNSVSSFPSLRILEVGGEMVDWGDVKLYQQRFSDVCKFVNRYACSENCGAVTRLELDKSSPLGEGRLPVGYPAKGVEIQIIDGEIVIHSPYLAIEYWQDEALTKEKFKVEEATSKRWYHTGDRGHFKDGILHHEGRI